MFDEKCSCSAVHLGPCGGGLKSGRPTFLKAMSIEFISGGVTITTDGNTTSVPAASTVILQFMILRVTQFFETLTK